MERERLDAAEPEPRLVAPPPVMQHPVLDLQRSADNAAVARLLARQEEGQSHNPDDDPWPRAVRRLRAVQEIVTQYTLAHDPPTVAAQHQALSQAIDMFEQAVAELPADDEKRKLHAEWKTWLFHAYMKLFALANPKWNAREVPHELREAYSKLQPHINEATEVDEIEDAWRTAAWEVNWIAQQVDLLTAAQGELDLVALMKWDDQLLATIAKLEAACAPMDAADARRKAKDAAMPKIGSARYRLVQLHAAIVSCADVMTMLHVASTALSPSAGFPAPEALASANLPAAPQPAAEPA
jgi:hypothetical protein